MKNRKLTERGWAIRIGTFKNSKPYFLRVADASDTPRFFKYRYVAESLKAAKARKHGKCWVQDWAIVRVTLTED